MKLEFAAFGVLSHSYKRTPRPSNNMMAVAAAQKNREMFAIKKSYSIERQSKQDVGVMETATLQYDFPLKNGYPARRRSLVDDARFETLVVKQTKQCVLEEARQRSNDAAEERVCENVVVVQEAKTISPEQQVFPEPSQVNGYEEQETMVEPETFHSIPDTEQHLTNGHHESEVHPRQCKFLCDENVPSPDSDLTEEEMILSNAASESKESEEAIQKAALVLHMREGLNSLARILKSIEVGPSPPLPIPPPLDPECRVFQNYGGGLTHLETRPSKRPGIQLDVLVKVDMSRRSLLLLIRSLRQSSSLGGVTLLSDNSVSVKDPWFPRHASELDSCNHLMTKYEPELDMNHPGFADKAYRERRKTIANIAFSYKHGDLIPHIDYKESEISTWTAVFNTVVDLCPKHACIEYQRVFALLRKEGIFTADRIPQLEEMSTFMKKHTGFSLRPAAGLLTARDFLASLAFRVFQSTQYVRHTSSPYHTPEPDCIHELLGHMPLLADPSFAQFSQEIGLASLGASDEEIEKLSTVYWFTVEFGLCKEHGEVKAYGAGLLSSYGELLHAISDKPEHRAFEPAKTAIQPYQDQEYQPIYYVAESFEDAKEKFRKWVSTGMTRTYEVRYNPHTQRIEVLDSVDRLDNVITQINTEMLHLTNALDKLKATLC
uniref:Biopterin-dependent aromatic amino acid hydroxylase family profile domain-containing protein n=1 Tax=Timema shepardi TaxID=629360 RepID=A0A7R9B1J7_TIMSH|nr:unnamed protein product [Timema shepardi]